MDHEPLVPRWIVRVLLPVSLIAAVGLAVVVRSVFTGVFLDVPEEEAAAPSPMPPFAAPARTPPPAAGPLSSPHLAPGDDPERTPETEDALETAEDRAQRPPRRSVWRRAEPDRAVSARVRARRQEVRRLQSRYRDLEREVRAQGGLDSPEADDALRQLERTARQLRRAEEALDRARREGR